MEEDMKDNTEVEMNLRNKLDIVRTVCLMLAFCLVAAIAVIMFQRVAIKRYAAEPFLNPPAPYITAIQDENWFCYTHPAHHDELELQSDLRDELYWARHTINQAKLGEDVFKTEVAIANRRVELEQHRAELEAKRAMLRSE
ncbi:hypothetical protein KKD71_01700 [Patescibacteria group bacterium]|nr:hypothetical protein [Patescibacteria group bacterium]